MPGFYQPGRAGPLNDARRHPDAARAGRANPRATLRDAVSHVPGAGDRPKCAVRAVAAPDVEAADAVLEAAYGGPESRAQTG
jgi:hypothetical protein